MLDIRFTTRMALRALRAAPVVTLLAVLSIGLGGRDPATRILRAASDNRNNSIALAY